MESLADDLTTMVRTPLADSHVAALHRIGKEVGFQPGDMVQEMGQPADHFHYLLKGELEAVDPATGNRYGTASLGPGQFFGEIGFLAGAPALLGARAVVASDVLQVPRRAMLDLMARVPEISDIVITVFAARLRRALTSDQPPTPAGCQGCRS